MKYRYAKEPKDIPSTPHFAVLVAKSITVPDESERRPDWRPAFQTEKTFEYIVFDDEAAWKAWITDETKRTNSYYRPNFTAFHAVPASVSVNVSVEIK